MNRITQLRRLIRETIEEQGWVPGRWNPTSGEPVDPESIDLMDTSGLGVYSDEEVCLDFDDERKLGESDEKKFRRIVREMVQEAKKKKRGLWANIHARRAAGKRPKRPGEKGYPKTLDIGESQEEDENTNQ